MVSANILYLFKTLRMYCSEDRSHVVCSNHKLIYIKTLIVSANKNFKLIQLRISICNYGCNRTPLLYSTASWRFQLGGISRDQAIWGQRPAPADRPLKAVSRIPIRDGNRQVGKRDGFVRLWRLSHATHNGLNKLLKTKQSGCSKQNCTVARLATTGRWYDDL